MVISEDIYAMLLTQAKFKEFTPNPVADATKSTEVLVALSLDGRKQVDDIVARAVASGGRTFKPATDHGFMYIQSFQDPDGHIWELFWMDPAAVKPA